MSQSQYPFVFPCIAAATQHWVALGSAWAKVLVQWCGGGQVFRGQQPEIRRDYQVPGAVLWVKGSNIGK